MVSNTRKSNAESILLEEQVDSGLRDVLDAYKSNYVQGGDTKDTLAGRWVFYPLRPLAELSHPYAKAFEAQDESNTSRAIYAMVCDDTMPLRQFALAEMQGYMVSHLVNLLAVGTVNCSHVGEGRTVIFMEKPTAPSLSEFLKEQPKWNESLILNRVLRPAIKVLQAMREKKVSHGHIYPNNVYMADQIVLGDCFSAPCGSRSHFIYEPLERSMADPLGRGDASEKSDVYTLAVVAVELLYGVEKIKSMSREAFLEQIIVNGSYSLFIGQYEVSELFKDFFRGILTETIADRWGLEQLVQWANGKRFNVIVPNVPKEASRPFVFANREFFGRRLLVHALHKHWRETLSDLLNLKLDRWCEMNLHRPELAERLNRTMRAVTRSLGDGQGDDVLTRVLCLLDPTGPMRSQTLSLRPDAIGVVLADVIKHKGQELGELIQFIDNDTSNFWLDQSDSNKGSETSLVMWRLQRVKPYIKRKSMGFGLERVLYDLNPSLACQSPLLKQYHVTNIVEALRTLDAVAGNLASTTSLADRHLAAFIASKIDITKELRLRELERTGLSDNQELVVLKLLAKAQQKIPRLQLVGLCTWAAMRIEIMIDVIHNRTIRKRLKLQLRKLAESGNLYEVLGAVMNPEVSVHDADGFSRAIAVHQFADARINHLVSDDFLEYKARLIGGKMAMMLCYAALAITSYNAIATLNGL